MCAERTSHRPVVLQVLHTLEVGGAEVLAARLARRLQGQYRFAFACLDGLGTLGEELLGEGFPVKVLERKRGIDVGCVRRLARYAADCGAQVIHAHQYTPFFYSRAPGWLGRRLPVLFTEHGRMHPDLPSRKRILFNRTRLRKVDRVVAVGEAVKTALVKNEGIGPERIQVIYNGVRLNDFRADDATRTRMRAELGIAADAPVAIQVARLDYLKDHSTALRAAERVRQQLPAFQLLLVGEGPERPKIESEISKRNLGGNVKLLGRRTDVRELLSVADLFLLTSISEGIPVTLIEAMAARVPVVSTNVGGVGEVVVDGQSGILCRPADDEALAAGVIRLLHHSDEGKAMAAVGAHRAVELFSEEQMHRSYAALYDEMAAARVAMLRPALQV